MDFEYTPRTADLRRQVLEFMERYIIPAMPRTRVNWRRAAATRWWWRN